MISRSTPSLVFKLKAQCSKAAAGDVRRLFKFELKLGSSAGVSISETDRDSDRGRRTPGPSLPYTITAAYARLRLVRRVYAVALITTTVREQNYRLGYCSESWFDSRV